MQRIARRRFQSPQPVREKNFWYLFSWVDVVENGKLVRKRKREKLAPASMPAREVRKIAAERLRALNQGLESIGGATLFEDYIAGVYHSTELPLLAQSTRGRYENILNNYLLPMFGKRPLRDLTPLTVQVYFSSMLGSPLAHGTRDKVRRVFSSVLASAVRYGLLVTNPVLGVRLPRDNRSIRRKPYLTPAQFKALIELIAEPYATMVYTAVFTGLRVSELIALRWRCIGQDTITIEERYCRGDLGAPKTAASAATIPVNKSVIERLQKLKELQIRYGNRLATHPAIKSSTPNDMVFQSVRLGKPMRDNNILNRHIKPAARLLGLEFVNWRCLRTSHATWLKMVGADIKDAQAQLRHARASTTLDIYQQSIPESQRQAIDKLTTLQ